MPRVPKKTPPTTVRFTQDLHDWVRDQAQRHPQGQSGVINDAVELLRANLETRRKSNGRAASQNA